MTVQPDKPTLQSFVVRAAESTVGTLTFTGLIVAGLWYFAPSVGSYLTGLVTKDLETRAVAYVMTKLDFYTVIDPQWQPQDSYAKCDEGSKLVAGACEGWSGTPQTSVGPVYEKTAQGQPRIHCMRYSTYQTKATAFCLRVTP